MTSAHRLPRLQGRSTKLRGDFWRHVSAVPRIAIPLIRVPHQIIRRGSLRSIALDTCELMTTDTPLSTMKNQVRKRVGFKANNDGFPNDGDRILDEQGTADICRTLELPS